MSFLAKLDKFISGLVMFFIVGLACVAAYAQVPDLPAGDGLSNLLSLILNWKTLSAVGIGTAVILVAGQLLKQYLPEDADGKPKYKRLAMLLLAVAYSVLVGVGSGAGLLPTLLLVLVTKGGAAELYEALKGVGLLKQKSP